METNKLNNQDDDLNFQQEDDDENLEPFDPTQIRITTKLMTMDLLLNRIKHDGIDLAPDFHRQSNISTLKAKSRLIESILIRIPLPAFYIDATDDDKWIIIDGLQRISTFKSFILDKSLKLTGLQFLKDLESKKYDDLPRHYQRRIDETELTVYLIEPGTPDEVKYNIFQRINTGALPLNNQEIRQSMNPGKSSELLKEFVELSDFKKVINLSENKRQRMDDREFVIGFIAFSLTQYENYPVNKGRNYFLNKAMEQLNKIDNFLIGELRNKFIISMKAAYDIFGNTAFRKSSSSPVNKALFEAWSVILSQLNPQQIEILIKNKEILKEKFSQKIQEDNDFNKSISQTDNKVKYRFEQINQIVQEVLSC
ncbi:DUF262 domain-containing protein [Dolichospermum circinale]|jgi:hypothetical protein|uniref:DUF262 domain-containing protein n=1 Tax=Dolichospermum circinale TaxID=109265 RepID=UPI00232FEBCD|nr:DUF262 domain-containing protein [Dolichospermum circinale]MDB9448441.1 DUF262 domain-containing protein [Dolichospermum circinale CS-547]